MVHRIGALVTIVQLRRSIFEPPPTPGRQSKMDPNTIETGIVDGDLSQIMDDLLSDTSVLKSVLVCHTNELVV